MEFLRTPAILAYACTELGSCGGHRASAGLTLLGLRGSAGLAWALLSSGFKVSDTIAALGSKAGGREMMDGPAGVNTGLWLRYAL